MESPGHLCPAKKLSRGMRFSVYAFEPGLLIMLLFVLLARCWLWRSPGMRRVIASERSSPSFIPQLEGLRGLLATAVVVYHSVLIFIAFPRTHIWAEILSNFYEQLAVAPVLMFFFLTGFLFWSKLLRVPRIVPGPYFIARFRRLLPVYLLAVICLFLLVAAETHFHQHATVPALLRSLLPWLLFTVPGMPDINGLPATAYLIAGTPWTLAMEWRFYLLLPLLAWFARKAHRCLYLFPPALLVYLVCSEQVLRKMHLPAQNGFLAATHATAGHLAWSFGVGIVVAAWRHREGARWSADSGLVSLLCACTLATVIFGLTPRYLSTAESMLLGLVFFCIVSGNTLWGLLCSAPMLLLGRCSFSMYLLHGLILSAVAYLWQSVAGGKLLSGIEAWALIALCSPAIFAISLAAHVFVEAPFMRGKQRSTNLPAVSPSKSRDCTS